MQEPMRVIALSALVLQLGFKRTQTAAGDEYRQQQWRISPLNWAYWARRSSWGEPGRVFERLILSLQVGMAPEDLVKRGAVRDLRDDDGDSHTADAGSMILETLARAF
jgi:hypothetical protein